MTLTRKLIVLTTILICALTSVNAQINSSKAFTVNVDIKGLSSTSGGYTISDNSDAKGYRREEIVINGDNFSFKGTTSEPTLVKMYFSNRKLMKTIGEDGFIPTNATLLLFVATPSKEIKVRGVASDFVDAYPYGDEENDILAKLTSKIHPLMNESVNLSIKLETDKSIDSLMFAKLSNREKELNVKIQAIRKDFLNDYASSIAGLWLMEDMLIRSQISMEDVEKYFKKVDSKYSNIRYYKALESRIEGYNSTKIGKIVEFKTTNTLDGKLFDITSLRGKYVILDFWGTWCGPCVKGMPDLKEFRDKNIDKLEVIAVNCGDSYERWENSKFTKSYNWIHIKSDKKNNDFVNKFNIQGYPTKILISPKGEILYRYVGEYLQLYKEIEKHIK